MEHMEPKTRGMVTVPIEEGFYFHRHLEMPTIIKEYPKIEQMFIENQYLGCMSIQVDQLRKVEHAYGSNTYNELLISIAKMFRKLKKDRFRTEDILVADAWGADTFTIFLSAPRKKNTRLLDHLEAISERIWMYIGNEIFKILYPFLKENVQPKVGYALVVRNPMIQNLRLITRLVADSVSMGNFMHLKKAYVSKYTLQKLIIDENIRTVYQPIVDLKSLEIIGYEALARGPEESEYSTPLFLFMVATECGLSFELDRLCRRKAFESVRDMKIDDKIFVNTLSMTIHDPEFRGAYLKELLEDLKIKPQNVVFEISEKLAIENYDLFRAALQDYTDVGIVHASDDIGKGYSDLERVMELRPGFLKVDMSLVRGVDKSYVKQEIIKAINNLAKGLNSQVVAEGIETKTEYETLRSMDIKYGQGFLFAPPSEKLGAISAFWKT